MSSTRGDSLGLHTSVTFMSSQSNLLTSQKQLTTLPALSGVKLGVELVHPAFLNIIDQNSGYIETFLPTPICG